MSLKEPLPTRSRETTRPCTGNSSIDATAMMSESSVLFIFCREMYAEAAGLEVDVGGTVVDVVESSWQYDVYHTNSYTGI